MKNLSHHFQDFNLYKLVKLIPSNPYL